MRVAIFHAMLPSPGRKVGGVDYTVHRLANALVQYERLSVTTFSCNRTTIDGLYEHRVLFNGRLNNRAARLTVVPLALNFVDFSGFDVLHLHGDDWFFVHRSIPTVRTMHGSALLEARAAKTAKRKALQYALFPLEHLSTRLATVSAAVGSRTQRIYKLSAMLDNGVDLTLFSPGPKSETPLLFYIGNWAGRKRGKMAFEVFINDVLPRFPEAKLYMAADYVPDHPSVIGEGFPSNETLAHWLRKAWVFLYPSAYEGFGIPYIESMASGTAIVTTRNDGAEYVLDNGRAGIITDDSNFGPAVVDLMNDAARRVELERCGLERVQRFSWQQVAAQHAALYRSICRAPVTQADARDISHV